ncbi:DUF302 domain-containing protein [Desulfosporosinus sp.]|uniref:DUF302 domain-containing protein n=1 Tax=Desulfosporosinus sp. TaxID=157907 RepID=UPI000E8DB566|nr:DUF302 domain-containing protein [Desulfosporosinus sp.]MBC2721127.1 DUF302 domain-containing protein [Desulfosporosinus sp.]MBC2725550.1 DUF302 domain-containing protein [Desulfosporosinus sp.]HBV88187.1 hypothetical protein [Desulfosporosinus sp.]
MEAIYQVTTQKSFDDAVLAVQTNTQVNGFRVLHTHDVQATLAEKDFQREPLKIIEVCNAKYAHTALMIDITVSLLMPCRINVYREAEKTVISTVKPKALVTMFNNEDLKDFANDVEEVLLKIIDDSV